MKKIRNLAIVAFFVMLFCLIGAVDTFAYPYSYPAQNEIVTEEIGGNTYKYFLHEGNAVIFEARVTGDVTVPETLGGSEVKGIYEGAFRYNGNLTSVTIPGCIEYIGENAFEACRSLKKVVMHEGVKIIEDFAFLTYDEGVEVGYDSVLESVTLPDSVEHIGFWTFWGAPIKGKVVLPENLKVLKPEAFSDTYIDELYIPENMKYSKDIVLSGYKDKIKITVDQNNKDYESDENGNIYAMNRTALLKYIPAEGETEFTVPDGVEYIGGYCFAHQKNLHKATFPDSVKEMGSHVFWYCDKLSEVRLSENLTAIPEYSFSHCPVLEKADIPSGVTEIGGYAFEFCYKLKDVTIPEAVSIIHEMTFYDCAIEGELVFSENVKKIGAHAFSRNDITKVTFLSDDITLSYSVFVYCKLEEVVFGTGKIVLDEWMFTGNTNLKKLSFPGGNVTLGKRLFENTGIETLEINCNFDSISDQLYNEDEFYNTYNVNNIKRLVIGKDVKDLNKLLYLPASLEEIIVDEENPYYTATDDALYNKDMTVLLRVLPSAKEYTFPETVREIGEMAFQGLDITYKIHIPEGIEVIGERAFYKANLQRLDIPSTVKKIGDRAFAWTYLDTIVIHSKDIEHIDDNMFRGCKHFKDFYYAGTKAEYKKIADSKKGNRLWGVDKHFEATPENHPYKETVTKATINKDGVRNLKCPCGEKKKYTIPAITEVSARIRQGEIYTEVKRGVYSLEEGKDYKKTVSYDKKKNIIKVKFTFIGDYKGTKTVEISAKLSSMVLNATANGDYISIEWVTNYSSTGSKLYKYNDKTKKWVQMKNGNTDYDVEPGKTYKYRMKSYSKVKELGITLYSDYSNITVKTPSVHLKTPVITKTEFDGYYKAAIYWESVEGAQGYTVFCSETPTGGYKKVASVGGNVTTAPLHVDFEFSAPTLYYKVRAYSKATGSSRVTYRSQCSESAAIVIREADE